MRQNLEGYQCDQMSVFMPAAGQCPYAVTMHTHPAYTFVYSFQPTLEMIIENKPVAFRIQEKNLIAMSPDIVHQELPSDTFERYIVIVVQKNYFENIFSSYGQETPIFKGNVYSPDPELLSVLKIFMVECSGSRTSESERVKNSLMYLITHLIARSIVGVNYAGPSIYHRFEVDKAIAYMSAHIDERITVNQLAGYVNLSESSFSHIFKQITNQTPIKYLSSIRLKRAKAMLINGEGSVTEIAIKCGFNSSSYFTACFYKAYKALPSDYIKQ